MTTYFVDLTAQLAEDLQTRYIEGWRLKEKRLELENLAVPAGIGNQFTHVQRWLVEDDNADPSLEGKLVEPVITQTYDEAAGTSALKVTDRRLSTVAL